MTPEQGDLDHHCRSWDPGVVAGPIADAAGDFWKCRGRAVPISAPEATESWLTVYRALLASHLSTTHRLGNLQIGVRLATTCTEAERLLGLAFAPLPDALRPVSRGGVHGRALAILGTVLPIPLATPEGESLLAALGGSTPDCLYPDVELVADTIGAHSEHFYGLGRPSDMKGLLFRYANRDVTKPLTLDDTASRPLRMLNNSGLVGGIDGTRLPLQRLHYDKRHRQWRPYTTWEYVVVGVAGKPSVVVSIRVGRESDAVVQEVVHDMAAAGVDSPFVLCHDGLATYKGDPFLLACLVYGFEPHEVNFVWENPAEAGINQLKSRWPYPCPKKHFGMAASDAVQEILDPVRGSSFAPGRGRGGFSEATLFLGNCRDLQPARVEGGAVYHNGVRIPVVGVPDGTPVLTGLRFDQIDVIGLDQTVEAHALAISLEGPSGTPQDWDLSMGITGVRSLGSTTLLSKHGRLMPLNEPTRLDLLPLPEAVPTTLAARLDLELARADARKPPLPPDQVDSPTDTTDDPEARAPIESVVGHGQEESDHGALMEVLDLPLDVGTPDADSTNRAAGVLSPPHEATAPSASPPCSMEDSFVPGTIPMWPHRREIQVVRRDSGPANRLGPLGAVAEEVAHAPFVPALPRWFGHPELQGAATTRGLVSGSRSLGVVLTGHEDGTLRSHTIISSATFQQVACQPLPGAPCPQVDPAGRPALRALTSAVDSAIRLLNGAAAAPLMTSKAPAILDAVQQAQLAAAALRDLHCGRTQFAFDWDGVLDDLWVAEDFLRATNERSALKTLTPVRTRLPRA